MTGHSAAHVRASRLLQTSLVLGALPSAVACARLHARNVMYEWDLPSVADSVELVVSEWKLQHARFAPFELGQARSRDSEHRAVHIHADHSPSLANALGRRSRDRTGATRDVKDPVADVDTDPLNQVERPRQRHWRDEVTLVQLRRVTLELPSFGRVRHARSFGTALRLGGHRARVGRREAHDRQIGGAGIGLTNVIGLGLRRAHPGKAAA